MTTPLTQKDSQDAATQQIAREEAEKFCSDVEVQSSLDGLKYATSRQVMFVKFLSAIERATEADRESESSEPGAPFPSLPSAQPHPSKARKEQAPRAQGSPASDECSEQERLDLAREAVTDWRAQKLSDGAAMFAISLAIMPQPKPTKENIARAKAIEHELSQRSEPRGQQQQWTPTDVLRIWQGERTPKNDNEGMQRVSDAHNSELAAEREHRKLVDKVLDNRCLQLRKMEEALAAAECQRREQTEEQLRNLTEAHIIQKKIDDSKLLSALAAIQELLREDGHYIECPAPNQETHGFMPNSRDVQRCKALQNVDLSALHKHDADKNAKISHLNGVIKDWQDFGQRLSKFLDGVTTDEWLQSAKQLKADAEVRKPLVDTLRFFKGELRSVGAWTPECQKAYDDALAEVKDQ